MVKMRKCKMCGLLFETRNKNNIFCSKKCATKYHKLNKESYHIKAIIKISNGGKIVCAVCGCPHIEALTIGHYRKNGKKHREQLKRDSLSILSWIEKTPIDEVLRKVRLECVYCQYYHAKNKIYPPENKKPKWE